MTISCSHAAASLLREDGGGLGGARTRRVGKVLTSCGVHSQSPGSHPLHPEIWGGGLRTRPAPGRVLPGSRGRGGTRRLPVTLPRGQGPSPPPGTWEPIPVHDLLQGGAGSEAPHVPGPQTQGCQRSQNPADCKSESAARTC